MRSHVRRTLTVLDLLFTVAGTALGLGLTRLLSGRRLPAPFDPIGPMSPRWGGPWNARDWAHWVGGAGSSWFHFLMPLLACWTVAVLAVAMRKPRPRFARVMSQPGTVACVAAIAGMVLWVPMLAAQVASEPGIFKYNPPHGLLAFAASSAVGSTWIILAVGGRWRAGSGWIDRVGRVLGAVWLTPIFLPVLARLP